jgi:rhodanese-related sulfurtransferase
MTNVLTIFGSTIQNIEQIEKYNNYIMSKDNYDSLLNKLKDDNKTDLYYIKCWSKLLLDKNKNYYVYCKAGARSAQACHIMNQLGFENTFFISGSFGYSFNNSCDCISVSLIKYYSRPTMNCLSSNTISRNTSGACEGTDNIVIFTVLFNFLDEITFSTSSYTSKEYISLLFKKNSNNNVEVHFS